MDEHALGKSIGRVQRPAPGFTAVVVLDASGLFGGKLTTETGCFVLLRA